MSQRKIIVGVDGSSGSHRALHWAADEAVRLGIELIVVNAYDWHVTGAKFQVGGAYADSLKELAQSTANAAVVDARTIAPGVNVRGEAWLGSPGRVLAQAADPDTIVVVGNRGRGGFASLALGSVSQHVATYAHGPVVVVRGRPDVSTGPIVLGIDTAHSDYALQAAFEEASTRGTDIVAVHAYQPLTPPWGVGVVPYVEDDQERQRDEMAALREAVAPWAAKYPDVPVELLAVSGAPAEILVRKSATAQLVIVGHRGGRLADRLLGPVAAQLLHHAESCVLIARGPVEEPTA